MQACVGLSPGRSAQAIKLVSNKQRDEQATPHIRVAAVWLALELGLTDTPALADGLIFLSSHSIRPIDESEFTQLVYFIISRVEKMDHWTIWEGSVIGLVALAPMLSDEQVSRSWVAIIDVIEKTTDYPALGAAVKCLAAIAQKLSAEQVSHTWNALIAILEKTKDSDALQASGNGLVGLAAKLPSETRVRTAELMLESLHRSAYGEIAEHLNGLVQLLEAAPHDHIQETR